MIGFPLLLIPLAIYNIIAFLMPDVRFGEPLFKLALMSGTEWPVTLSDVLLAVGILLLLLEIVKGARPGAKFFTDHLLSLIVFGAAAAEFVLWPKFGTSTYFLLTALALVDFLSGLALRARRVAVAPPSPAVSKKSARQTETETAAAEPQFEPAPVPSAASIAEPVLKDHPPAPAASQPAAASNAASPEVLSPGLQPGGPPHSPDTPPR
jgi:hypothetical protein